MHADESLLLGLDIGTSATKGVLLDATGRVVAEHTIGYRFDVPRAGWCEQDPETWWQAARGVLRALSAAATVAPSALGLTGQMHGSVFLDAHGRAIRPALLWNDQRTAGACRQIESVVGGERLRRITGNPALTGFQAPKLLWLRDSEPAHWQRVRHVLLPKDFIRFRLIGELATDASDASGTLLLDLRSRRWSAELLDALALPPSWLPTVLEGPEFTGRVHAEAAAATGLAAGTPVVAGAGDNAAAAVANGIIEPGSGLVSVGTSGAIFAPTAGAVPDPTGALHAFCHCIPDGYHLLGAMLSAGGSLQWAVEVLSDPAADRDDRYIRLLEAAAAAPPGAEGLYFLPYLAGERTPHMDPDARGAWIGLSLAHGRGHLVRAVLEGVAFGLRDALRRLEALEQAPPVLRLAGGGLRNWLWRDILTAVLDRPVRLDTAPRGPAVGAAMLAAVGGGVHASVAAAVEAMVPEPDDAVAPDAALAARYAELHAGYAALYPALKRVRRGGWTCPPS